MKTLESNISEAWKVQVDCLKDLAQVDCLKDLAQINCLKDLESDSYDKDDMKEKANDLVRLHEAIQEKLKTASFSVQIQVVTLVPDKRSQMYC